MINTNILEEIKEKIYIKAEVGTEEVQKMVKEFFDIYQTEIHDIVMADPDVISLFTNYKDTVEIEPCPRNKIVYWKNKNKIIVPYKNNELVDPDTDRELLDVFDIFNFYGYWMDKDDDVSGIDNLKKLFPQTFKKLDPIAKRIMKYMKIREKIEKEIDQVLVGEITIEDIEEFAPGIYEIYNGK